MADGGSAFEEALFAADAIEDDLSKPLSSVLVGLVVKARRLAVDALVELVEADPNNADQIRTLQGEVNRYRELGSWIRAEAEKGREIRATATPEDRQIANLVRDQLSGLTETNDA